jgi:transcriptional regulator with XRE-family HTH domain
MPSANEKFGMRVRELREHKRLGQEQLGKQLGVKKQTVSNWERGRASPDLETLTLICAYFQVSPNELFGSEMPRLNSADASHIRLAAIANVVPLYSMTEGGTMLAKVTEKIAAKAYLPVHVDHLTTPSRSPSTQTARAMGPKFP